MTTLTDLVNRNSKNQKEHKNEYLLIGLKLPVIPINVHHDFEYGFPKIAVHADCFSRGIVISLISIVFANSLKKFCMTCILLTFS